MSEGAVTVAPDGLVLYCNERFAEMLARSLNDVIGQSFVACFGACDAARVTAALDSADVSQLRFKASLRAAEGRVRPVNLAIQRLPEDSLAASVVILTDLTDLENEHAARLARERELQQQVQQLNYELEDRVRKRTAELAAANEELDAFAYSVSHDLRTPLRAIDGFTAILVEECEGRLNEDGKYAIARVRESTKRMASLIDDMLKLSRSTRGAITLSTVDLSEIATSCAASLREADPDRNVTLSIAPGISAQGDPVLLRAVLENLLSNAWKFTAKLPNALIEFHAETKGHEIICHVRDNGAGFDMAYAHHLFQPFQRLHVASEFTGNGIGLATVKRIIFRLGGQVSAQGAPGQGATFSFSLPLGAA
jgi:light-regulated signal transduction histidine kinase (bacteriophytochrome)